MKTRKGFLNETTDVPVTDCPVCGYRCEAATNCDLDYAGAPKPNDWTICATCGALLCFTDTLSLRRPTADEVVEFSLKRPEQYELMQTVARALPLIVTKFRTTNP